MQICRPIACGQNVLSITPNSEFPSISFTKWFQFVLPINVLEDREPYWKLKDEIKSRVEFVGRYVDLSRKILGRIYIDVSKTWTMTTSIGVIIYQICFNIQSINSPSARLVWMRNWLVTSDSLRQRGESTSPYNVLLYTSGALGSISQTSLDAIANEQPCLAGRSRSK